MRFQKRVPNRAASSRDGGFGFVHRMTSFVRTLDFTLNVFRSVLARKFCTLHKIKKSVQHYLTSSLNILNLCVDRWRWLSPKGNRNIKTIIKHGGSHAAFSEVPVSVCVAFGTNMLLF